MTLDAMRTFVHPLLPRAVFAAWMSTISAGSSHSKSSHDATTLDPSAEPSVQHLAKALELVSRGARCSAQLDRNWSEHEAADRQTPSPSADCAAIPSFSHPPSAGCSALWLEWRERAASWADNTSAPCWLLEIGGLGLGDAMKSVLAAAQTAMARGALFKLDFSSLLERKHPSIPFYQHLGLVDATGKQELGSGRSDPGCGVHPRVHVSAESLATLQQDYAADRNADHKDEETKARRRRVRRCTFRRLLCPSRDVAEKIGTLKLPRKGFVAAHFRFGLQSHHAESKLMSGLQKAYDRKRADPVFSNVTGDLAARMAVFEAFLLRTLPSLCTPSLGCWLCDNYRVEPGVRLVEAIKAVQISQAMWPGKVFFATDSRALQQFALDHLYDLVILSDNQPQHSSGADRFGTSSAPRDEGAVKMATDLLVMAASKRLIAWPSPPGSADWQGMSTFATLAQDIRASAACNEPAAPDDSDEQGATTTALYGGRRAGACSRKLHPLPLELDPRMLPPTPQQPRRNSTSNVFLFIAGLDGTGHHFWREVLHKCPFCQDAISLFGAVWRWWFSPTWLPEGDAHHLSQVLAEFRRYDQRADGTVWAVNVLSVSPDVRESDACCQARQRDDGHYCPYAMGMMSYTCGAKPDSEPTLRAAYTWSDCLSHRGRVCVILLAGVSTPRLRLDLLATLAKSAGVDFRVLVLTRDFRALVISPPALRETIYSTGGSGSVASISLWPYPSPRVPTLILILTLTLTHRYVYVPTRIDACAQGSAKERAAQCMRLLPTVRWRARNAHMLLGQLTKMRYGSVIERARVAHLPFEQTVQLGHRVDALLHSAVRGSAGHGATTRGRCACDGTSLREGDDAGRLRGEEGVFLHVVRSRCRHAEARVDGPIIEEARYVHAHS